MFVPKKTSAFTLVEVMTVTAIMGIMVMAVAPAVSSANKNAKASKCSSNLRMIQSAKAAYLMENIGKLVIDRNNASEKENFLQYFPQRTLPVGCPSSDNPESAPYQHVYDLYVDVACGNNCPEGGNINNYPLEPKIGGPDYYRNGYHDLYRRKK